MSVQQFCLRWNNHQPNFISVCSSLLHNGTLVDVTLAAEGRQLQAHKIVLSACSSYFQTLFTTNPCQHPIVILKDVQYDDLKTMVDFMYYGEVNVSQEQLPHILKTAEMLKIKGLAEMPTDPANLTKSESKSSNDATEMVGSGAGNNLVSGGSSGGNSSAGGGLGSSSGAGSVSDSLWGSTESQFQQHQQQQQQHQHQQHHQQLQQQQQHHHQQQQQQQLHAQLQNSQTQTTQQQQQQQQQHHQQLRRTPSPLGAGASPATRRKRLRKSSNNGSGERTNSDDHNTSLDAATAGGLTLSQMSQMTFGSSATNTALGGLAAHSLHTAKLLKESSANDLEQNPQDSDSLDDTHGHVHMQIKPEVDISGVQQQMPLDISGATTPSEHDAPNSQSAHSGLQWTVVESNYSRFSLPSCPTNLIGNTNNTNHQNPNTQNNNSSSSEQHHQQQQQQQQRHQQQQQDAVNSQQQQQQHNLQQLQQYQQQHQQNSPYTPQIITVSQYTNAAAAAAVAAAQNMSPPSPNDGGNMVQTVYSQGPSPSASPIGNTTGSAGNNSANNPNIKRKRSVNPQDPAGSGNTFIDDTSNSAGATVGINMTQAATQQQMQQQSHMGTKRNRVLTRQPRVKRDSDSLSNTHLSPEPTTSSLDFEPFGSAHTLYSTSTGHHQMTSTSHHHHLQHQQQQQLPQQHHLHHPHHMLSVPPRIERHASEPAPSLSPTSPHLLAVPQSTPFLIKQHSDPLLPSQHSASLLGSSPSTPGGTLTNPFAPLHRQYSHPLSGNTTGAYLATSAPLQHSHHISLPESIYETSSPPPAGSSQYIVPQGSTSGNTTNTTSIGSTSSPTKSLGLPQCTSAYMDNDKIVAEASAGSPPIPRVLSSQLYELSVSEDSQTTVVSCTVAATGTSSTSAAAASKFRGSKSASANMLSERSNTLHAGSGSTSGGSSFEHLPILRVRNEELQRSVSSPQTSREIITLENPRSSHCPVIRPGPALGCNFCWNTIDGHGRILRRKTKYHCPECQTNLCIVPCFQEYHERLNNEQEAGSSTTNNSSSSSSKNAANSTGSSATMSSNSQQQEATGANRGGGGRHFTKTETF